VVPLFLAPIPYLFLVQRQPELQLVKTVLVKAVHCVSNLFLSLALAHILTMSSRVCIVSGTVTNTTMTLMNMEK
jgi:hypothetical protein